MARPTPNSLIPLRRSDRCANVGFVSRIGHRSFARRSAGSLNCWGSLPHAALRASLRSTLRLHGATGIRPRSRAQTPAGSQTARTMPGNAPQTIQTNPPPFNVGNDIYPTIRQSPDRSMGKRHALGNPIQPSATSGESAAGGRPTVAPGGSPGFRRSPIRAQPAR